MRYWSLLFVLAIVFVIGSFDYAPFSPDRWLPNPAAGPGPAASGAARGVDALFLVVLGLTGAAFAAVAVRKPARVRGPREELAWTLVPAGILLYLAFHRMSVWADVGNLSSPTSPPFSVNVTARRFHWTIDYPGPDGEFGGRDDLSVVDDLHLVKGEPVLVRLRSADATHSFFLPRFRVKRDAIPGATVPVRFRCDRAGRYELACAEFCGRGHYGMRADVVVHETRKEFEAWRAARLAERNRSRGDRRDVEPDPGATAPAESPETLDPKDPTATALPPRRR